jgi:hypothetical protein
MKTNLKSTKCKKKLKKKQKGFNQKKFKRWNLKKKIEGGLWIVKELEETPNSFSYIS